MGIQAQMVREILAWWDEEEKGGYGYDWSFAPIHPKDPEYRQAYAEAQRIWLEHWWPYEGERPN